MRSAAATLLVMMGLIAPFSCEIGREISLPINDDLFDVQRIFIGPEGQVLIRPERPKNFQSADDIKNYLDSLRAFYAMMGRPRFGKRGPVLAVQRHTVQAEKTRKVQQVTFPGDVDDYGDEQLAAPPFRRRLILDDDRNEA